MAHFCERVWQASGETYQAFVPTTLDADLTFSDEQLAKFSALDQRIKAVQTQQSSDISDYFDRYIAGGNSLKDGRLVSRKRLALQQAGLPKDDPQAQVLRGHADALKRAVVIGCAESHISIDTLKLMSATFKNEQDRAGSFRRTQGWIGGKSPLDAYYVCPPAELLEPIIIKLCEFINRDDIPATLKAAVAHMQLLIVHPFSDGNGRMSRALVEVIMRRAGIVSSIAPPMFLYRLTHEQNGYIAAVKDFEQQQYDKLFDYWLKANDWAVQQVNQLSQCKQVFLQQSHDKLRHINIQNSPLLVQLLVRLFEQPIVTIDLLCRRLDCRAEQALAMLNLLKQSHILKSYQLKEPRGYVIWDAPLVFELIGQFDKKLFAQP